MSCLPQTDILILVAVLMKKVKSMGSPQSSSDSANADRSYAHDDHYDETHLRSRRPQRAQKGIHDISML